jgi:hypothetical protein
MGRRTVTGGAIQIDYFQATGGAAGVRRSDPPANLEGEHMIEHTARRAGAVAVAVVACLLGAAAPALADNPPGVASAGSADFTKSGQQVVVPSLAPCSVGGPTTASTPAVSATGVKFGASTSSCTTTVVDPENAVTTIKSEAKGKLFELSALLSAGGVRMKVDSWTITCTATQTGTTAGWEVGGLTGFPGLPQQIPVNYLYQVKKSNAEVLANVTFAEVLLPEPNDGSIAMHLIHFRFAPASGITGEVVIGAAACSPTP